MADLINRKAAVKAILNILDDETALHNGWIDPFYAAQKIRALPSADVQPSTQPEIKPIEYRDCSNAMLRMWMDNIVTDGEYNLIMDKLNAHWGMKNGRFNQPTGGDRCD